MPRSLLLFVRLVLGVVTAALLLMSPRALTAQTPSLFKGNVLADGSNYGWTDGVGKLLDRVCPGTREREVIRKAHNTLNLRYGDVPPFTRVDRDHRATTTMTDGKGREWCINRTCANAT